MAGAGAYLWEAGEVVTAANLNQYVQDQVVMRFANAAARTAAFGGAGEPVLAEGMVTYLMDTDSVEVYDGAAFVAIAGGANVLEVQVFS
jgi:hypothetical protein